MATDTVTFFVKKENIHGYHEAWPRSSDKPIKSVTEWIGRGGFSVTVKNEFTNVIVHNVETRNGGAAIVPRAVIPLYDKGIKVKIDFRIDGLLDMVKMGNIENGVIKTPLHIVFNRGRYSLVPINY